MEEKKTAEDLKLKKAVDASLMKRIQQVPEKEVLQEKHIFTESFRFFMVQLIGEQDADRKKKDQNYKKYLYGFMKTAACILCVIGIGTFTFNLLFHSSWGGTKSNDNAYSTSQNNEAGNGSDSTVTESAPSPESMEGETSEKGILEEEVPEEEVLEEKTLDEEVSEKDTAEKETEEEMISIVIQKDTYPLQIQSIPYEIVNRSGKDISVLLIPILERKRNQKWEKVEFSEKVGFCGTPDQIESVFKGNLQLSWYENSLTEGLYRFSFQVVNDGFENKALIVSNTFSLCGDIDIIDMSVKENEISSNGITLIIKNNSEQEYTYGEEYTLEVKSEGTWKAVAPIIKNYGFKSIGYTLGVEQPSELVIDWKWLYGNLPKGEYRIRKEFYQLNISGDYDIYERMVEVILK